MTILYIFCTISQLIFNTTWMSHLKKKNANVEVIRQIVVCRTQIFFSEKLQGRMLYPCHIRYTPLQILLFEGAHQKCYNRCTAPNLAKLKSVFLYFFRFSVFLHPFQLCVFILLLCFLYVKFVAACCSVQSSETYICLFVFGATAPSWLGPPHSRDCQITHNDAPQSLGLLWTSDRLVAETST